ncbi:MAG: FHA domain-containing protein [Thermoleophilaceae bacterium]
MFGAARPGATPRPESGAPTWLEEARSSLEHTGDYLAYDPGERAVAIHLGDGWTRIGRSISADVRLDDPTVSRRHALIYRDEQGAKALDDRSLNGIFRNGERIELAEVADGDTLTVGRFDLHFLTFDGERAVRSEETAGSPR